jgi:hypothetical protein
MLKFLTQVALSQDVTSIALLSLHESHSSSTPLPTTHGIILVFAAEAVGGRSSKVVRIATSEMVVNTVLAAVTTNSVVGRIIESY